MLMLSKSCLADTRPSASPHDERVGIVDYKADDVVVVTTALGVVTRIILGSDEQIVRADAGFTSDCEISTTEWCIRAEVGTNQITVKPRRGATRNNLEVSTNRRDYSFALVTRSGAENAKGIFYRVVFRIPLDLPARHVRIADVKAAEDQDGAQGHTAAPAEDVKPEFPRPDIRNVSYAFKSDAKGAGILPSVVFDDGRYTYFKFPKSREVPAVFATDADGEEIRVPTHAERLLADVEHPGAYVDADFLVVRRISRAFRLRLGTQVAEVINNAFDPDGVETLNGTTTKKLRREDVK
jgi:type IV secretion system protein VirB9